MSTATAGIPVLPPGAADVGVLLDDGEGDAGALQLDRRVEAAEPAADDDHVERLEPLRRRRGLPVEPASPRVDGELLDPELHVLVGELEGARQAEAGRQPVLVADRDLAGTAIAVGLQELGALPAEQLRVVGIAGQRGRRVVDVQARSRHLVVAGELVQQPAQRLRGRRGRPRPR